MTLVLQRKDVKLEFSLQRNQASPGPNNAEGACKNWTNVAYYTWDTWPNIADKA